jgi:hypothetical protein
LLPATEQVKSGQKATPQSPGVPKGFRPSAKSFSTATDRPDVISSAEQYWGSVILEDKSFCPIFIRLLAAIFNYFDSTVQPLFTRWMEPSKLRAVLMAAGYSTQDVPLPSYFVYQTPPGSDIHELDQILALVYRGLNVDHRMATRDPLLSPYQEPFSDGLRANSVPNGMPMLSRRGFEQYLLFQVRVDPTETSIRINHLLQSLPPLLDNETKQPFTYRHIPRSCFPPLLDPVAEELRRSVEKQRKTLQAWKDAREIENAWRQPALGDDLYNKMMPGDFRPMSAAGWRTNGRFAGGY